jgi:3-methyladenine DNA glycosylase AlkC
MMDAETLLGQKWPALLRHAQALVASPPPELFSLAVAWYGHAAWEVRAVAVQVLGGLAARDPRALAFLYEACGQDPAWQVNEALAMAFDDYCAALGYAAALPTIETWLRAPHANLRRAVSEGLRPWTARKRPYFAEHPDHAVALLGLLKDDESRYVQESAGNALRDISRKHFDLVLDSLRAWLAEQPGSPSRRVIARFALEAAVKTDPSLRRLYDRAAPGTV